MLSSGGPEPPGDQAWFVTFVKLSLILHHVIDFFQVLNWSVLRQFCVLTFGFMIPSCLKRVENMSMENTSLHR